MARLAEGRIFARTEGGAQHPIIERSVVVSMNGRRSETLDALIGTGAAVSAIPKKTADKLQLRPAGIMRLKAFDGTSVECQRFWVDIKIPDLKPILLCVVAIDSKKAIIGYDILQRCQLLYDGGGQRYYLYPASRMGRLIGHMLRWVHRFRSFALGHRREVS